MYPEAGTVPADEEMDTGWYIEVIVAAELLAIVDWTAPAESVV
jgi:hypothetical protein